MYKLRLWPFDFLCLQRGIANEGVGKCCRGNAKGEEGRFSNRNPSGIVFITLCKHVESKCCNTAQTKVITFPLFPVGEDFTPECCWSILWFDENSCHCLTLMTRWIKWMLCRIMNFSQLYLLFLQVQQLNSFLNSCVLRKSPLSYINFLTVFIYCIEHV